MGKWIRKIVTALAVALVLFGTGYMGFQYFRENYVLLNGRFFNREARKVSLSGSVPDNWDALRQFPAMRQLDARNTGMTAENYKELKSRFPECQILWDVPFQGSYYSQDTEKVVITSLTKEDVQALDYLPNLTSIDAWDCEDYPQILQLQQRRPDCKIFYSVPMAGKEWDCDITILELHNADMQELEAGVGFLPKVKTVFFTGKLPEMEKLEAFQKKNPGIFLFWKIDLFGMTLEKNITELDLTDAKLTSVSQVEEALAYFPLLEKVNLFGCSLPEEELVEMAKRHPQIHFLFEFTLGKTLVRTDAVELDISNNDFWVTDPVEEVLPLFHDVKKVVMCQCGISSEDMDALNRRYADIRFVWSVNLGGIYFRTDAVHYTPNRWGLKVGTADLYDLRYCTDMVCVDIGHQDGVYNCEWAAFMPNLKYLILAQTHISDLTPLMGLENLVFLELFQSSARDYSPLLECKALEDLNLCYTYGDPTPISQMTWLKRVWWTGSWTAKHTLPEALPNTEFNFNTVSSTGGTWREGRHYYEMRDFIGMEYMEG